MMYVPRSSDWASGKSKGGVGCQPGLAGEARVVMLGVFSAKLHGGDRMSTGHGAQAS